MYQTDFDEFKQTLSDLCVAVNRPFTDDLARVFWEDLKPFPLPQVKQRAKYQRAAGKRNFTSNDLRPEPEPARPANTYEPAPSYDMYHCFAQRALFRFLKSDGPVSQRTLQSLIAVKNQIVSAAREGREENAEELRGMLLSAFSRVLKQEAA